MCLGVVLLLNREQLLGINHRLCHINGLWCRTRETGKQPLRSWGRNLFEGYSVVLESGGGNEGGAYPTIMTSSDSGGLAWGWGWWLWHCGSSSGCARPPGGRTEVGTKGEEVPLHPGEQCHHGPLPLPRQAGTLRAQFFSISKGGCQEPKTIFVTFCLSSPKDGMGLWKAKVTINLFFQIQFKREHSVFQDPGFPWELAY